MRLAMTRDFRTLCVAACWLAGPAFPQGAAQAQRQVQKALNRETCPGDPPGNLEHSDCSFTAKQHLTQFVAGSLTDQALVGATFFGTMAQFGFPFGNRSGEPPEQDWNGLGYRVGSRYAQNLTKGLTVYTFSSVMRTDPRHLSYVNDPGSKLSGKAPGIGPRLGHVFVDWVTVRRSTLEGNGRRLPNLPLFAGAAASGYVGNIWYPDRLTTNSQALQRGVGSLGTALLSSFYTEFSPEIGRMLGAVFKRGSKKTATPTGTTATTGATQ
jgi:hypothetical protein